MVRMKVHGTQQQITLLTQAARHTGLVTPNKFLAALFDGNHIRHQKGKPDHSLILNPSISRRPKR